MTTTVKQSTTTTWSLKLLTNKDAKGYIAITHVKSWSLNQHQVRELNRFLKQLNAEGY